jgi:hypothetical protein
MTDQFFFLSTRTEKKRDICYTSEKYRISELEIFHLIRLLYTERRNRTLGNKILEIYRDATEHRKQEVDEKLKKIGIDDDKKTENISRNSDFK